MTKSSSFLLLLLVLGRMACAAPIDRDLGRGLAYHRVHELPADLVADASQRPQPRVLDLRFVHVDSETAQPIGQAVATWVKARATPRAPVIILANAATTRALLAPLTGHDAAGSVVIIGAAAPGFEPDIAVKIAPDIDRRAYDALEAGASVESLTVENADKPRNDEAQLAKERQPDPAPFVPASGNAGPSDDKAARPKPAPPLIDATMQRAVQLHRTLLALKKL